MTDRDPCWRRSNEVDWGQMTKAVEWSWGQGVHLG